jgi:hypothetical protein
VAGGLQRGYSMRHAAAAPPNRLQLQRWQMKGIFISEIRILTTISFSVI